MRGFQEASDKRDCNSSVPEANMLTTPPLYAPIQVA